MADISPPRSPKYDKVTKMIDSPIERSSKSPTNDYKISDNAIHLQEKLNRKKTENELQLLANRIALLRTEEKKMLVRVGETKSRAKEVLSQKKRNEDSEQQRLSHEMIKVMRTKELQERAQLEKVNNMNRLRLSRKLNEDAKKAMGSEKKMLSKKMEQTIIHNKVNTEVEKRIKAEEERKRKDQIRMQRERERIEKEKQAQEEYFKRVEEEASKRREAESLIAVLEKEEKELIERIKKTQKLQQDAYGVLKKSLV